MKRFLFLMLVAAVSSWGALANLYVGTGTATYAVGANDAYITDSLEVDGVVSLDIVAVPPDDLTPDVAGGNIFTTGINTGATAVTDLDNPRVGATYTIVCGSVAGGFQSTIADAGNFTLHGAWNPVAVGDSITVYCRADNDYVEVSRAFATVGPSGPLTIIETAAGTAANPAWTFTADIDSGVYNVGADDVGVTVGGVQSGHFDATGLVAVGLNGPLGTVTPAAATVTDLNIGGDSNFGQNPEDLIGGYKDRGEYISYIETFDHGSDAHLAVVWNVAGVVGAGTNTVTGRDGWNQLITGGAGGPDMESTVTNGLNHYIAYAPRIECVVELAAVAAGQTFFFGFLAAANEFAEIIHEPATSANWLLRVDDTAGAETIDSGVPAVINTPTKLEISVTAGGVVDWAIDDVDMATVGLTNNMTANPHYVEWRILDVAAAAHTVAVDYFISEQLRQQ